RQLRVVRIRDGWRRLPGTIDRSGEPSETASYQAPVRAPPGKREMITAVAGEADDAIGGWSLRDEPGTGRRLAEIRLLDGPGFVLCRPNGVILRGHEATATHAPP